MNLKKTHFPILVGIMILIFSLELLFFNYVYYITPPLPPEISVDLPQIDIKRQAKKIHKNFFDNLPDFSKQFYYFYGGADACRRIFKAEYGLMRSLKSYNREIRDWVITFPKVFLMLRGIMAICIVASILIYFNRFIIVASGSIIAASLLPLFSGSLIGYQREYHFYWMIPSLIFGLIFFGSQVINKADKIQIKTPKFMSHINQRLKGTFLGIGMIVIGTVVTVGGIAIGEVAELGLVIVGAPVFLALFGIYVVIRNFLHIFTKHPTPIKQTSRPVIKTTPVQYTPTTLLNKENKKNFVCPMCKNNKLIIEKSIELGPDARNDENSLQAIKCGNCGFHGVAYYQESRRGAGESWEHTGYPMQNKHFQQLLDQLNKCQSPSNSACRCKTHQDFRVKNKNETLNPLEKLSFENHPFPLNF